MADEQARIHASYVVHAHRLESIGVIYLCQRRV
jgi:hypothetical protein